MAKAVIPAKAVPRSARDTFFSGFPPSGTTFPLSITRLLSNRTLFLAPDMHPFDKSHARCMKSIAYTANWNESVALGL